MDAAPVFNVSKKLIFNTLFFNLYISTYLHSAPVVDTDCDTETDQDESQLPIESSKSSTDITAELRKERYRLSALVELKLLKEIKAELVVTSKRRDKCVKKLQLLTALKTRALQHPNYREERFSELHDAIERLTESHCHHEKEFYKLKGLRAVGEAKTDHYVAKLTPELKYTDMYSEGNSFYLSPILEESDADL